TCIGAPACQAARIAAKDVLERLDPALAPPGGAGLLHPDTVLGRRLLRRVREPAPALPVAHGRTSARLERMVRLRRGEGDAGGSSSASSPVATAPSDSANRSRSSLVPSSVIHCSPVPTTFEASSRFCSSRRSIFSSTVPAQTSLWTCTARFW